MPHAASFLVLVLLQLAVGTHEKVHSASATQLLDVYELAFLQRLQSHELFALGELVGVFAQSWTSADARSRAKQLAEWDVTRWSKDLTAEKTAVVREALVELGYVPSSRDQTSRETGNLLSLKQELQAKENELEDLRRNVEFLQDQLQEQALLLGEQLQEQVNAQCSERGLTAKNRMRALKDLGFNPKAILDVGANTGEWTREMKTIFPDARFFMVEANMQHKGSLEKIGSPFRIAAVGHVDNEEVDFYKTAAPGFRDSNTGASIFKEINNKHFEGENLVKERVVMRTIDSLVEEAGETGPFHLLKLDVQGAEIVALQGARAVLEHTAFVLLELSVTPFNLNAPLAFEAHAFMERIGFMLVDVVGLNYNGTSLLQVDALFRRKRPVQGIPSHLNPPLNTALPDSLEDTSERLRRMGRSDRGSTSDETRLESSVMQDLWASVTLTHGAS
jgi:FkbM family methyltransferase